MSIEKQETQSVCPVCLQVIPAYSVARNGHLYLEKNCPQHGQFSALIWRGTNSYERWGETSVSAVAPARFGTQTQRGCPYDCGLCPDHKAQTCTAIIEVTQRCNMACPVCFASSPIRGKPDPDLDAIERMYLTIWKYAGYPSVQLSGGEPTLRDDLPEIVDLGKKLGFPHIQINTNGIRIAKDPDYLRKLVDAGADLIYLQFDGVSDDVYRTLRGRDLLDLKVQAVRNCAQAQIGVLLVPTVYPQVNLDQLGEIVQFAKDWIPYIKGIHFQPITHMGRYPVAPKDEDWVTIPDVIQALDAQTNGELKAYHFLPRRSQDAHCSFNSVFVLGEDGQLHGRTNINYLTNGEANKDEQPPAMLARAFIQEHWRYNEQPTSAETTCCCCSHKSQYSEIIEKEKNVSLTITGMPFQDVWNIDFERLKRCCVHVVTEQERLVPFCAYYLTSISGERLY